MSRLLALSLVAGAMPALAADVALNAGVLEVAGLPGPVHVGLYPNVAVSVAVPAGPVTLIPSLGLEWAPALGRGGFVAVVTADWALHPRVGLDVMLALIHDMPGLAFARSDLFAGGGVGCSLFFGRLTVSPFVALFAGLVTPGLSLVPGVNLAWTLASPT
jgi:hypothetical protein